MERNLSQIWDQLRGQRSTRSDFLEEVSITKLRGIQSLTVTFPYPVSVLAGPNGCGKSTVLFAAACAYRRPKAVIEIERQLTPTSLFPRFLPTESSMPRDAADPTALTYSYVANGARRRMKWERRARWGRSFFGEKRAKQPERLVYLRTLSNLSNPAEARSILQTTARFQNADEIDSSRIAFAHSILQYRYQKLSYISRGIRSILFAERGVDEERSESGATYSEFHMSAGERAILRLSIDVSFLNNALVLVDEVEAGLHPYAQQMLLLELQRLALRNNLQIILATHSPVVLASVPPEARIFLERDSTGVSVRPPYQDIIQKSLYGQSLSKLTILCEDEVAEGFVRGVLDYLGPKMETLPSDVEIGRNTGKDEFPSHVRTLAKLRRLRDIVFILDGDALEVGNKMAAIAESHRQAAKILFIPDGSAPEAWAFSILGKYPKDHIESLGISASELVRKLGEIDSLYAAAADKPRNIMHNKFFSLSETLSRKPAELIRILARNEAAKSRGSLYGFVSELEGIIGEWRAPR